MPRAWNDWLALLLLTLIPALWAAEGRGLLALGGEVRGALIATWTLVVQYYFRKAPPGGGGRAPGG